MSKNSKIDRPIFVVGAPRSGTTLLYNMLCGHEDLAWFSNITSRLRMFPQLAFFSRLYKYRQLLKLPKPLALLLPKPFEGFEIWDTGRPVENKVAGQLLTEKDVTSGERNYFTKIVSAHLKYQGKRRFINKNIRNSFWIDYLNGIFPDARFVHIVRDPRGTAASLLSWKLWPLIFARYEKGIIEEDWVPEWIAQGKKPAFLAAKHWLRYNHQAIISGEQYGERYLRIHYEDLANNPKIVLHSILKHSDLEWNRNFENFVDSFNIRNMNYRISERLTEEQIRTVKDTVEPLFAHLDYDYRQPLQEFTNT